jgi:hypothetical protein
LFFFRYMDELFGFLLRLLDEKLFGEGGFLFSFFFTADILLVPSCAFGIQKQKGRVPAPSFVGGTGRDHGLRQGRDFW